MVVASGVVVTSVVVVTSGVVEDVSGGGFVVSVVVVEVSGGGALVSGVEEEDSVGGAGVSEVVGDVSGGGEGSDGVEGGHGRGSGAVYVGYVAFVVTAVVVSVRECEVDSEAGSESRKTKTLSEDAADVVCAVVTEGGGVVVGTAGLAVTVGAVVTACVVLETAYAAVVTTGAGRVVPTVSEGAVNVAAGVISVVFSEAVSSDSSVTDSYVSNVVSEAGRVSSGLAVSESDSCAEDSDSVKETVASVLKDVGEAVVTSESLVEEQETKERSIAGIIKEAMIFLVLFFIILSLSKLLGFNKHFLLCKACFFNRL